MVECKEKLQELRDSACTDKYEVGEILREEFLTVEKMKLSVTEWSDFIDELESEPSLLQHSEDSDDSTIQRHYLALSTHPRSLLYGGEWVGDIYAKINRLDISRACAYAQRTKWERVGVAIGDKVFPFEKGQRLDWKIGRAAASLVERHQTGTILKFGCSGADKDRYCTWSMDF
jgi:hypothetical protein